MSMTINQETSTESPTILQQIPCIQYLVQFQGGQTRKVQTLIYFGSKVNTMTPSFEAKLGFATQKTSVTIQKIDGTILETYDMALANFCLQSSLGRV